mmetsp:Transcript_64421/g.76291  ORF Transcript_64421/g.76291 Transcript_64421/m.76291 type:complete len:110 (-) Transcript_64421:1337-1666(-)
MGGWAPALSSCWLRRGVRKLLSDSSLVEVMVIANAHEFFVIFLIILQISSLRCSQTKFAIYQCEALNEIKMIEFLAKSFCFCTWITSQTLVVECFCCFHQSVTAYSEVF